MDDKKQNVSTLSEQGSINYANDVVAKIAALAASEVEGILGTSGGSLQEMLGVKNLTKGLKVQLSDNTATVDINVIVEYGCKIHEVCKEVQSSIIKAIENMTGLKVNAVNVNVNGINIPKSVEAVETEETEDE